MNRGISQKKKPGILELLPLMPEDKRIFWNLLDENDSPDIDFLSLFPDE